MDYVKGAKYEVVGTDTEVVLMLYIDDDDIFTAIFSIVSLFLPSVGIVQELEKEDDSIEKAWTMAKIYIKELELMFGIELIFKEFIDI